MQGRHNIYCDSMGKPGKPRVLTSLIAGLSDWRGHFAPRRARSARESAFDRLIILFLSRVLSIGVVRLSRKNRRMPNCLLSRAFRGGCVSGRAEEVPCLSDGLDVLMRPEITLIKEW